MSKEGNEAIHHFKHDLVATVTFTELSDLASWLLVQGFLCFNIIVQVLSLECTKKIPQCNQNSV